MSPSLFFNNKKYISAKEASSLTGYSQDYIGQLARDNKIDSRRIGRVWYVGEESILKYNNSLIELEPAVLPNNMEPAEISRPAVQGVLPVKKKSLFRFLKSKPFQSLIATLALCLFFFFMLDISPVVRVVDTLSAEAILDALRNFLSGSIPDDIAQKLKGEKGTSGPRGGIGPMGPMGQMGQMGLQGPAGESLDPAFFVSQDLFENQVDGIFDSIDENVGGLAESLEEEVDTNALSVSGNGSISGNLGVGGNLSVVGTITGNVAGTINPSFTLGSVPFQGASGLAEDNANFFWDDADNRLGIGTASPSAKLHSLATTEQLRLGYDASNYTAFTVGSTGYLNIAPSGGQTVNIGGTISNGNYRFAVNRDVNQNLAVGQQGGELSLEAINDALNANINLRMYASQFALMGGNVGIGDTSPDASLEVVNDGTGDSFIVADTNDGDTTPFMITSIGNVGIGANVAPQKLTLGFGNSIGWTFGSGNSGVFHKIGHTDDGNGPIYYDSIWSGTSTDVIHNFRGNSSLSKMVITEGGNVGIGTTAPGFALEIKKTGATLAINDTTTATPQLVLQDNGLTRVNLQALNDDVYLTGTAGNDMVFRTDGTERVRFLAGGNVGIGDASPDATLEVVNDGSGDSFLVADSADGDPSPFVISSSGNVGIGGATEAFTKLLITGNLDAIGGSVQSLLKVNGNIIAEANVNLSGINWDGSFTEAASGGHPLIMGTRIGISPVAAGSATVANTASLYVEGAMSATVTGANYALWVDAGTSRFDGDVSIAGATTYNGNLTVTKADPSIILDTVTATDTDFWLGVQENAGGNDDDTFQIGDGTTPGSNAHLTINTSGNVGIGTTTVSAKLHSLATTEQLRLGYDATNFTSFTTASDGSLTITPTGSSSIVSIKGPGTTRGELRLYRGDQTTNTIRIYTDTGENAIIDGGGGLALRGSTVDHLYLNAGVRLGDGIELYSNWTTALTASNPIINLAQTWNSGAVTFTGQQFNVINTASASGSKIIDWQIGGTSAFNLATNAANGTAAQTNAYFAGNVGIGTTTVSAKLHSLATTEQLRLGYDAANYAAFTTDSAGDLSISPTGSNVFLPAGSISLPGIAFIGDTNTGLSQAAVDRLSFIVGGVRVAEFPNDGGDGFISQTDNTNFSFNMTPGTSFSLQPKDSATAIATTRNSPVFNLKGYYWDGGASALENFTMQTIASTTPANSYLDFGYGGSGGFMTIRQTGNVGIGTTTPTSFKLEVAGNIGPEADNTRDLGSSSRRWANIYGNNIISSGSLTATGHFLPAINDTYDLGSDSLRWRDLYLGGETMHLGTSTTDEATLSYNTTTNILGIGTDSTTNGDIAFFTDDLYLDKSTGNVGVGTAGPSFPFHVYGSNQYIAVESANAGGDTIISILSAFPRHWQIMNVGGTGAFQIRDASAGALRSTITTAGNMGIGSDTTPDYLLELHDATATPAFALSDDDIIHGVTTLTETDVFAHLSSISTTDGGAQLTGLADATGIALGLKGVQSSNPTDTTPAISLIAAKASGTGVVDLAAAETVLQIGNNDDTAALTVLGSGNVGIGTTTPSVKLTVVGPDFGTAATLRLQTSGTVGPGVTFNGPGANVNINFDGDNSPVGTNTFTFTSGDTGDAAVGYVWTNTNVERMRVTPLGQLLVGSATALETTAILNVSNRLNNSAGSMFILDDFNNANPNFISLLNQSTPYATIDLNGGTAFRIIAQSGVPLQLGSNNVMKVTMLTSGNLGIGDTTPDYLLELHDATATPAFALSDDDIIHGVTTLTETDVFAHLSTISTTDGGAQFTGLADNVNTAQALSIRGILGNTPDDTVPAIKLIGAKGSGTGIVDLAAAETVLQIANNDDTAAFTVLGDGKIGIGDTTPSALLEVGDGTDSLQVSSVGDITFVDANGAASITGPAGGAFSLIAGAAQALTLTGNLGSTWSTSNGLLTITGDDGITLNATSTAGITANVPDNLANAIDIQQGSDNYLNVNTTNSSENIGFGNATTNPSFSFLGTGNSTFAGNVGVGTVSPETLGNLTVAGVDAGSGGIAYWADRGDDDADKWLLYTGTDGTFHMADKSTGSYVDNMTLEGSTGDVGIGNTNPAFPLDVYRSHNQFVAGFFSDGNNTLSRGLYIQAGEDSGTGTLIEFADGNGDALGAITFSAGTVLYGEFTANHNASLPEADNALGYEYGTLVCIVGNAYASEDSPRGIKYDVEKCDGTPYNNRVLGAYGGKYQIKPNSHQVYVLGDGQIIVNGENGDINIGDRITTSSVPGEGMRATEAGVSIGTAQEDYHFDSPTDTKLVAVQYGVLNIKLPNVLALEASNADAGSSWFDSLWEALVANLSDFGVTIAQSFTRVTNLFADTIHIENKLCVDDVCISKENLKALLLQASDDVYADDDSSGSSSGGGEEEEEEETTNEGEGSSGGEKTTEEESEGGDESAPEEETEDGGTEDEGSTEETQEENPEPEEEQPEAEAPSPESEPAP